MLMGPQAQGWHPTAGFCPLLAGLAAGKGWQGSQLGTGLCRLSWFWPKPLAEVGARAVCHGQIRNQLHGIPAVPWHLRVLPCMPGGWVAAPWMPVARAELASRWAQRAPSKAVCPVVCRQLDAGGCPGMSQSWQEVTLPPKVRWWPDSPAAGRGMEQAAVGPFGP